MRRIDRYVLAQLVRPFAATLVIALLVLLLERLLRVLDLVLGAHGPVRAVFAMLAYLVPHYLGVALPAALFLAVFLAFAAMRRASELDAMAAAGIGLGRLLRPLALATLVVAVLAFLVFSYLQPLSRYYYRALVHAVTNVAAEAMLPAGVFTTIGRTTFLIDAITLDRRRFTGVFVHREEDDGRSVTVVAERGALVRGAPDGAPVARLVDGARLDVPDRGETAGDHTALSFEILETPLGDGGYRPFRARGEHRRELTLFELWHHEARPIADDRPARIRAELHSRLVRIASIVALPLLAVPLALGRRRSGRSFGLVVGLGVLVAYNEVLDIGFTQVADHGLPPGLAMWLPCLMLVAGSAFLFTHRALRIEHAPPWTLSDRLGVLARRLVDGRRRRAGAIAPERR